MAKYSRAVARHAKHRRRSSRSDDPSWDDETRFEVDLRATEPISETGELETDWFGPTQAGDEVYAARQEAPLAAMLMLGEHRWQRIDGMGLARQALEAPMTGDKRMDLSDDERFLLANGRAWCLVVHSDLGHGGRNDDPIVLADAQRHIDQAQTVATSTSQKAQALITQALIDFRRDGPQEALAEARNAAAAFAAVPDPERSGQNQGAACLAIVTLALVTAASGDRSVAGHLSGAAQALRPPLDVDQVAFGALMNELSAWGITH